MINTQYKLVKPFAIESFHQNIDYSTQGQVIVRPTHLSVCKADLRYYHGQRSTEVLKQRLPLALIHEATGIVLNDTTGTFETGARVILLPNIAGQDEAYDENYRLDSLFRSSRADGFMQEAVAMKPEQVIPVNDSIVKPELAAISEFISVGVHALETFIKVSHSRRDSIAVWGDGALGYVIACLIKEYLPEAKLTIIGIDHTKMGMFSFADEKIMVDELPKKCQFDHAFECVGGQASGNAINQVIDTIMPQGTLTLMGVSEEPVPVNTRMVLEKGMTLIGRSRSRKEDFEKTVELFETSKRFRSRISMLISEVVNVRSVSDIHRAFDRAKAVNFKLVMDWTI